VQSVDIPKIDVVDHISYSQIGKWQRCPRQWKYHYVDKLKEPAAANLILGSAYHKALETNYLCKVGTGNDLPIDACLDAFSDSFANQVNDRMNDGGIEWGESDPFMIKCQGIELVRQYMEIIAPSITPLSVEALVEGNILGVRFVGYIDLVQVGGVVCDHKTSAKSYTQGQVDGELQPLAYGFGLKKEIDFEYHVAIKTKQPKVQQIARTNKVTQREINWWVHMVEDELVLMQTGVAPPRPGGWWCSEKMCGFWNQCHSENEKRIYDLGAQYSQSLI